MKRAQSTITILALLTLLAIGMFPAFASDRSSRPLKLSLEKPEDQATYGPLVGNDPELILVHPVDCKASPACDTVPLELNIPPGLLYRIIITTSWEGQDHDGTYLPDIDVYIWEETIKRKSDGTNESTFERISSSATAGQPEIAKVADLPPSSPTKKFYITPVLWAGQPANYTIKVQFFEQHITRRQSPPPRRTFEEEPDTKVTFSPKPTPSPSPTLSPVKVPGENGPLVDMSLMAVEQRFKGEQKGPDRTPLIAATLAFVLLGAGLFTFFFVRARRQSAG